MFAQVAINLFTLLPTNAPAATSSFTSHALSYPMRYNTLCIQITLVLEKPSEYNICDACLECCERCFAYWCHSCNFLLDIECASGWQTKPDYCHQHDFFPIFYQIRFTCEVCGEDALQKKLTIFDVLEPWSKKPRQNLLM